MKPKLIIFTLFGFMIIHNVDDVFATNIYAAMTYALPTKGRADRQQYDPASMTFGNSFGSTYSYSGGLGYLVGINAGTASLEYRTNNESLKRNNQEANLRHNNLLLIGKANAGNKRLKLGVGIGNATIPSVGNAIIATDTNYNTTSYLFGMDFVTGNEVNNEKRHFFVDYITIIAHSRTFRIQQGNLDIGAREQVRYSQINFGYMYHFGDIE